MFGKDKTQDDSNEAQAVPVSVVSTSTDVSSAPPAPVSPQDELNLPAPTLGSSPIHQDPGTPEVLEEDLAPEHMTSPMIPAMAEPTPDAELSSSAITISTSGSMRDLTSLKQEALHELSPLINQLDQTPDEKYATAKMVYEETNDQALLTAVYEAAKNLSDEKEKAEAIYDVIKKINDFTASN